MASLLDSISRRSRCSLSSAQTAAAAAAAAATVSSFGFTDAAANQCIGVSALSASETYEITYEDPDLQPPVAFVFSFFVFNPRDLYYLGYKNDKNNN